jgi:hypothetical protein
MLVFVLSVEAESQTTSSSAQATDSQAAARLSASLKTLIFTEIFTQ